MDDDNHGGHEPAGAGKPGPASVVSPARSVSDDPGDAAHGPAFYWRATLATPGEPSPVLRPTNTPGMR